MKSGAITKYEKRDLREQAVNAVQKLKKKIEGKQVYRVEVLNGIVETTNPEKWRGYKHEGFNAGSAYFNLW